MKRSNFLVSLIFVFWVNAIFTPLYAANDKQPLQSDKKTDTQTTDVITQDNCSISNVSIIMNEMSQNIGRAMPNGCRKALLDVARFSGGVNIDVAKFGSRHADYTGESYHLAPNDSYLNMEAMVHEWTKIFLSVNYGNPTTNANPGTNIPYTVTEYSSAYSNNIRGGRDNTVQFEQTFMTFGNVDVYPVFLQVGKQFQNFGRYQIHPITRSMTQVLSETLTTSSELGVILPGGFYGSLFAFVTPIKQFIARNRDPDYGLGLGYHWTNDWINWDIGGSYLYNMMGVSDIAYQVVNYHPSSQNYTHMVGGYAFNADINVGSFSANARYVGMLQRFSPLDLPQDGAADYVNGSVSSGTLLAAATGAKPWAAGVQGGYTFELWGAKQNAYLGYQASSQAGGLILPESRWIAGYNVDVWKYSNFAIEWDHDIAYAISKGGSGNHTNLVSLRVSAMFS